MRKTGLILAIIWVIRTDAQTWVTIPDANFASNLQTIVGGAMNGNQLNISSPLVASTHSINVYNKNITNLSGIQYFSSLTYLNCGYNQISSLPALAPTLVYFSCGNNHILSLPNLPSSLVYLYADENSLTNLPALPTSLYFLDCSYNSITSLPTLPDSLRYLFCEENHLSSLPALPDSLKSIVCHDNYLTALPSFPSNLQGFLCYNNNINCFPIFPHSITSISLDPNPFNCLPNYIAAMGSDTITYPICALGNSNGCTVTGIEQVIKNKAQVIIYPNPTNGIFSIETHASENQTLKIFDVNGRLVFSQIINGKTLIDVDYLEKGVYNLNIYGSYNFSSKKLVLIQ